MKRWGMAYSQVRRQRRELAIYEVWLAHREEIEKGLKKDDVGVLDRLPVLLAPHGVTVEQARAPALADMSMVQLKTRVVARLLLATPQIDGAEIAAALGGESPSTASTYRKAAEELIGRGYNPEAGFDPDISQE
ncbi:hypothetical protein [Streptomyces virginiae]|uniref:hypothetical protein n=1 Tax=Streptomyces virginiae TaxID=1961 RepID=UPI0036E1CDD4